MKRLYMMATAIPLLALVAAAQDDPKKYKLAAEQEMDQRMADLQKMVAASKVIGMAGAAMGPIVKGAPYSAVEVSESNQVLADGTRIHNENQTTVYRDSEGRVRRETPNQTTIMDPVAGVSYFLNPKTLTATKGTLSMPAMKRVAPGSPERVFVGGGIAGPMSDNATFEVRSSKDGTTSVTVNGKPVDPSTIKMEARTLTVNGAPVDEQTFAMAQDKMKMAQERVQAELSYTAAAGPVLRSRITNPGKTEALGKQMIEGVNSDGTRVTTTLDTGVVGNDRPIQMVSERWYSSELQTQVMTKHSDPRTGETIFRLTNVSRSEPGVDLFQVPTNYQIIDRK
jgi:hypothetical protein